MNAGSRSGKPIWAPLEGETRALERHSLGLTEIDGGKREVFIQELVHRHPSVIPMNEIEPAYAPLISVCRELSTDAGYLDNLWITPTGALVLGECKLVKNPQARREVIAQGLDYARAISTWGYQELEEHARKGEGGPKASLWDLVKDKTDLDEAEFVDAVERRLRAGRMMILIIGDGIQEGAEALSDYLQMHAGIHAGLALVDLSIWQGLDGGLLVVPRVPMRTVLVERGVVSIDESGRAHIGPPAALAIHQKSGGIAQTLSEVDFYDQLAQRRPEAIEDLKAFVASLAEIGVTPEFKRSMVLRWWPTDERRASAGYIDVSGFAWLGDAVGYASVVGRPAVGEQYLSRVASAIGGSLKRREKNPPIVVGPDGRTATVTQLLAHAEEWKAATKELVEALAPQAVS